MFAAMNAAFEVNNIHPTIDRIFPLSQAKDAFHYLQSASHFGKIVLALKQ
jgi:NADPH:quinone reductase-like Zn-dependent oxidoreductase